MRLQIKSVSGNSTYARAHGDGQRALKGRMNPYHRLPRRIRQDHRGCRILHHRLGRLVQQSSVSLQPRLRPTRRVRGRPRRDPQIRAATRIGAAQNLGRFNGRVFSSGSAGHSTRSTGGTEPKRPQAGPPRGTCLRSAGCDERVGSSCPQYPTGSNSQTYPSYATPVWQVGMSLTRLSVWLTAPYAMPKYCH